MAQGKLQVVVAANRVIDRCPFCGSVLEPGFGGRPQFGRVKSFVCYGPTCVYGGWNLPEMFWDAADNKLTDERLRSAYEQFKSSLESEKEKMSELAKVFESYKAALLKKSDSNDWSDYKSQPRRMTTWKALIDVIEKHTDGEQ